MREFAYISFSYAETTGRDREEATTNAFAFMDAHSKGRRKPAAERYEVFRVRRTGPGSWRVYYRARRPVAPGEAA